jgi:hypothetical protein
LPGAVLTNSTISKFVFLTKHQVDLAQTSNPFASDRDGQYTLQVGGFTGGGIALSGVGGVGVRQGPSRNQKGVPIWGRLIDFSYSSFVEVLNGNYSQTAYLIPIKSSLARTNNLAPCICI